MIMKKDDYKHENANKLLQVKYEKSCNKFDRYYGEVPVIIKFMKRFKNLKT